MALSISRNIGKSVIFDDGQSTAELKLVGIKDEHRATFRIHNRTLTVYSGEWTKVAQDIEINWRQNSSYQIRLRISAPQNVKIMRKELLK